MELILDHPSIFLVPCGFVCRSRNRTPQYHTLFSISFTEEKPNEIRMRNSNEKIQKNRKNNLDATKKENNTPNVFSQFTESV